jgi:hypothetical protein
MQRTVTFADLGAAGKWSADALVGVSKRGKAPQGTFPVQNIKSPGVNRGFEF